MLGESGLVQPLSKGAYSSDGSVFAGRVEQMYGSYHSGSLSYLEDCIAFGEDGDYLKRYYEECEFASKILMLSEYYQYHRELPRIFHPELTQVVEAYQEDVRSLEYRLVTRKLRDDGPADGTHRERTARPVERIIKNIELSYYDFENKEAKRPKAHGQRDGAHRSAGQLAKAKKSMPSLKFFQCARDPARPPLQRPIVLHPNAPPHPQGLRAKDANKPPKSRPKESLKKVSLNNSAESHRNLSRSKSKSNLPTFQAEAASKRGSVRPFP